MDGDWSSDVCSSDLVFVLDPLQILKYLMGSVHGLQQDTVWTVSPGEKSSHAKEAHECCDGTPASHDANCRNKDSSRALVSLCYSAVSAQCSRHAMAKSS
eukprot:TRINITY_DN5111_c1_g1_i1.p1 TRINITY_DN5111_c1_g1~~TRINITY_DN5111_c1_g1_i1.p1  ORF type:complete len:100 (+),score=3.41 TRINITY_DN5111_c1_g1_i1:2-301(+)